MYLFLFFLKFHLYFDHIHSPPHDSFQIHCLFSTHPTLCPFVLNPIKTNLCCLNILGYVSFYWSMINLLETILLEKPVSPSPRS